MRLWAQSTAAVLMIVLIVRAQSKDPPIEPPLKNADRQHWAFQKPVRPTVPTVKSAHTVRNPIDAFVQAKREANGLSPAKTADKLSLLRRLAFDLTGLPPTTAEIDA